MGLILNVLQKLAEKPSLHWPINQVCKAGFLLGVAWLILLPAFSRKTFIS